MRLKIEYLPSYVGEPIKQARPGDAGFDLRATTDGYILPGGFVKIPLGIRTSFEEGYEAQLRARSGLAAKNGIGLVNGIGTIDAGYRGEWAVLLYNHGHDVFTYKAGDRVCQVVFNQLPVVDIQEGPVEIDGDRFGGFGSTGVA